MEETRVPKGRFSSVILIWTILAALFGTLAQAQEDSTGNWRIRHLERLTPREDGIQIQS